MDDPLITLLIPESFDDVEPDEDPEPDKGDKRSQKEHG